MRIACFLAVACAACFAGGLPDAKADELPTGRTQSGLLVLYDFRSTSGDVVRDRSGVGQPLDLRIDDPKAVRRSEGSLEVRGKTVIRSEKPATKVIDAVRRSGAITIEAWVRPAKTDQTGPARIVTLSKDTGARNFTLGHDGNRYDVRLRTTAASTNGIPSVNSPAGSLKTRLTHVVYTRDRGGNVRIYLNGKQAAAGKVGGAMNNWDGGYRFALANELSGDRPWLGTYSLVAVYGRNLSAQEAAQNFAAGARAAEPAPSARTQSGLLALYDFSSTSGPVVNDRSGTGEPLNLRITDAKAVRRPEGMLEVRGKTLIRSDKPATKIIDAVRRSGALTIEAWIRPARADQEGPARIVTLSGSPTARNFTLGHDGNRYDVRLRTTATSTNGIPSVSSPAKSLQPRLTHVVYTRDRGGNVKIYLDGKQASAGKAGGATNNWDGNFRLALANELSGDRPWLGTYSLVAVYGRNLSAQEVARNFAAGARVETGPALAQRRGAQVFETQVAALFARHCLECHDTVNRKGKLDLSRKSAALAGGESGKAIVPGKAGDSLLWELVSSDAMPQDRDPLSAAEKKVLREWIDAGAVWSLDVIDPAVYAHEGAARNFVRRLTVDEYIETVRATVGVDIEKEARELLPPDLRADGFKNTAYNLAVDLKHVDAYARLAEIAVSRMDVLKFAAQYTKDRQLTDDNMRGLVAKMGHWVLRGPLEEHEVVVYRGISTTVASAGGNFEEAVSYILEAMLQSPRFIYRVENQRGDGTAWPVGNYELASRLSYILWGGPPDKELMRAADAGELADRARVAAQVERMLADPRTVRQSKRFLEQWLNLDRLANMQPNAEKFPRWDPALAADMRAETLAFFEHVAWKQNRPLAELLNAQVTFVTPRLARHYGLKPQGGGSELKSYDVSKVPGRGGLLTHGSVLTVGGDEASMVSRGLFVLKDLLRGTVKDPPPCVDTTPVPTKPGLTQRAIAEARIKNANCGGCHSKFEPLAFGLEKFDGLGSFHEKDEHGNRLRDDGEILFPGTDKPVAYESSAELMNLLADSERVQECLTWKVTQFALGRPLTATDAPIVARIHESAKRDGGTYAALITAVVMSDLVQKTRTETDP